MKQGKVIKMAALGLLVVATIRGADGAEQTGAQQSYERVLIESAAQIPARQIRLKALPSEIIASNQQEVARLHKAFADYIQTIDRDYQFADKAALRKHLSAKLLLAMRNADWQSVIEDSQRLRQNEEKPASKQLSGLLEQSYAEAAIELGSDTTPDFSKVYADRVKHNLANVDLSVARDHLDELIGDYRIRTENFILGWTAGQLDNQTKSAEYRVSMDVVQSILSAERSLSKELLVKEQVVAALAERLAREPIVNDMDRWAQRSIELNRGHSTIVAIWDTGMDVQLQQGRLWTNPDKTAANPHGLAFDRQLEPQVENLPTTVEPFKSRLESLTWLVKGVLDAKTNIDSQAAADFRQYMASVSPEQMSQFQLELSELATYAHGQMVADVAAQQMGSIKLMNIMMTWPSMASLSANPMDEAYVEKLLRVAHQSVDFMQQHGVRVANLSWRISVPIIEKGLLISGSETDAQVAKQRASEIFNTLNSGLIDVFESAPEILFVVGAGNEDENVEFVKSTPAGINLPNLVTIGAVNQALQPTSFTSFGESIDLYANGYQVPARMPGGLVSQTMGTSISAPLVTNLAAKILAIKPTLNPVQVVQLLNQHATVEGEQKLLVIDPKSTLCSLGINDPQCGADQIAKRP